MTEPPLPHLTGAKSKPARKTNQRVDLNSAQVMIASSIFLFAISLFLWKTIYDLHQAIHIWNSTTVVATITIFALSSISVWMFWTGWQQRGKVVLARGASPFNDAALAEPVAQAPTNTRKANPLAMTIVFFIGFLVEGGFGLWMAFSTSKSHHPSLQNIIFAAFCSLGFLGGSIWGFRWWVREYREKLA